MQKNKLKMSMKGITLIALVVTIVVLLILAGVSISMLTGENGIIIQAQNAKLETRGGDVEEKVSIWKNEHKLNKYSQIKVKNESDFINDLKEQKLVFDNEIDEEHKIIKIGSREIYYGLEENEPIALKFLVNSGEDGVVVLPVSKDDCGEGGYEVDWGDGTTGLDETVIANKETKLANIGKLNLAIGIDMPSGMPHTYSESNKEYIVTITGVCNSVSTDYGSTTENKIIEVLQWGETGLIEINLNNCVNLRKVASPTANTFINAINFNFSGCTGLTSIPEDLFLNCINVTYFDSTFNNCKSLTTIPENLFSYCPNVISFNSTFSNCTNLTAIPANLFANCPNVTYFSSAFSYCTNLTSIPGELFTNCPNVISFGNTFRECKGLTNIPANLFANCSNVTDFSMTFYLCEKLTNIPEGLFSNCLNVTNFGYTFDYCRKITSIPADLFANCPNVTSFKETFECCSITSIPENLFANCPNVTDFSGTFSSTEIISIPANLFANCPNVTKFEYTFRECTNLTGNAPELWTRVTNGETNEYKGTPGGKRCFYKCKNFTNYEQIPEYWK